MLSRYRSVEMRTPSTISRAALAVVSGVRRLSLPHWSSGPKRPQALPGGPSFRRGRSLKDGLEGIAMLVFGDFLPLDGCE